MIISSKAYLGVEVLVQLKGADAGNPYTAQHLATSIGRSLAYTEVLMSALRASGLVNSKNGCRGGYWLTRPAHGITVAEIFEAFDQPCIPGEPFLAQSDNAASALDQLQDTSLLWESLRSYIMLFLGGVSLSDLMSDTDTTDQDDSSSAPQDPNSDPNVTISESVREKARIAKSPFPLPTSTEQIESYVKRTFTDA